MTYDWESDSQDREFPIKLPGDKSQYRFPPRLTNQHVKDAFNRHYDDNYPLLKSQSSPSRTQSRTSSSSSSTPDRRGDDDGDGDDDGGGDDGDDDDDDCSIIHRRQSAQPGQPEIVGMCVDLFL